MNILLIGAGGREHTFAWKIAQSPKLTKLFISPGNAGTGLYGDNVMLKLNEFEDIKNFCLKNEINLIVVGPEEPLVNGITDFIKNDFDTKHIGVVGPVAKAALLEGSKEFAKEFMEKYNIPTASYKSFSKETIDAAFEFLKTLTPPYVIKADGLAAGKGVVICSNIEQAKQILIDMLSNAKFGKAGEKVVVEAFLSGIEMSFFIATDGESYKILPHAKDYKKIGENDKGLNTGGMGAVSPVPFVDKGLMDRIINNIVVPTLDGLKSEHINYQGFIFFGLMIVDGMPYVIEYNARMGDPETEVVLPLIKTDIIDFFQAIAHKQLHNLSFEIEEHYAATVMLTSEGYPGEYIKNKKIIIKSGIDNDCQVFHAGTIQNNNGELITNGGRVMAVTCFDKELDKALKKCYSNIEKIHFDGMYCRKDIGKDMLKFI